MARRIVKGGYETTLWARSLATLSPFADTSAKVAESPAELAAASDLVCLCVVADADIDEVTGGEDGPLAGLNRVASSPSTARCTRILAASSRRRPARRAFR